MGSDARSHWPRPAEAPDAADLARCVHCGLCVNACPTYLVTGNELESPRGRIALARGVAEGTIPLTATVEAHWDRCLQCRACEVACPSGVAYGRIIERARAQVTAAPQSRQRSRRLRRLLLRQVVTRPGRLAMAMFPVRLYAGSFIRPLARRTGLTRLLGPAARLERQLVPGQGAPVRAGHRFAPPGRSTDSAILFTGCVMGELFGEVHRATSRLLARRDVAVEAPAAQGCCGALSAHDGDLDHARALARKNIAALEGDHRPIVVNAAGCGAALKEYGELLREDAEWAARAEAFSERVVDLAEYLSRLGVRVPSRHHARVAYQDACHLAHVQRITTQPRDLLAAVEGCELVETEGASVCCGAAGLYGLVEPGLSSALRQRKIDAFREMPADVIVTANPGCHLQYQAAVAEGGLSARVMHLAEFLDLAERAREE